MKEKALLCQCGHDHLQRQDGGPRTFQGDLCWFRENGPTTCSCFKFRPAREQVSRKRVGPKTVKEKRFIAVAEGNFSNYETAKARAVNLVKQFPGAHYVIAEARESVRFPEPVFVPFDEA